MARLSKSKLERVEKERYTKHKVVRATYSSYYLNDDKYFQIDTFGKEDREFPEKISQTVQIDKDMAVFLVKLLIKEFDLLNGE